MMLAVHQISTASGLLVEAGKACAEYHTRVMRTARSKCTQADKIWSFCYAKQKNACPYPPAIVSLVTPRKCQWMAPQ